MIRFAAVLALLCSITVLFTPRADAAIQVGAGAHYWMTLDDLDFEGVDNDGVAYYVSILLFPEYLLRMEIDIEKIGAGYRGADENVYAPAAYVVLGKLLYAAAGAGAYYTDGEVHEDLFYALRVGYELNLFGTVYLDINANYRFDDWGEDNPVLEHIDTDTVTLGAAVRVEF